MKKWGCDKCDGLGYRTLPQMARRRASYVLELCECVQPLCRAYGEDHQSPWVYFDEKTRKVHSCECKGAHDALARTNELFAASNIPAKYRFHRLKEFNHSPQYPNPTHSPELEAAKRGAQVALTAAYDKALHFIDAQKKLVQGQHGSTGLATGNIAAADLKGLFLIGPPGTGKSLLAAMILNELILTAHLSCRYVKISRDFFQQLRATFNSDSGSKTETVFNDIAQQDILVIDDFGIQSDSEWEQRMLYDLVDARYEAELPTIITSNIDLDAVKSLFKGRIYSRLTEMLHIVEFFSVRDYRQDMQL
ncbi:MAG: ATP-binding protein [Spirochaetes bacterium]|nr:ATP-binding protein [Spirochaetota bacterium]MBX3723077.1 ATP-binding protein [Turneriella sp.]